MKICIPIQKDLGINSPISLDLNTSPYLIILDATSLEFKIIPNLAQENLKEKVELIKLIDDFGIDAFILNNMDSTTFEKLESLGQWIIQCHPSKCIRDNVILFNQGDLPPLQAVKPVILSSKLM